jgi:hypothetical protein
MGVDVGSGVGIGGCVGSGVESGGIKEPGPSIVPETICGVEVLSTLKAGCDAPSPTVISKSPGPVKVCVIIAEPSQYLTSTIKELGAAEIVSRENLYTPPLKAGLTGVHAPKTRGGAKTSTLTRSNQMPFPAPPARSCATQP